jgi:hypothetical protein
MRLIRASLLFLVVLLTSAMPAHALPRSMSLGLMDGSAFSEQPGPWLQRAADVGANVIRVPASWGGIAPTRPQNPTDPNDPAYRWAETDAAVDAARKQDLTPVLSLTGAPAWATGAGRPADVDAAAWRPDAAAYGQFAVALARRYTGRVQTYLPWNEPNLAKYLAPQWVKTDGRWRTESPRIYRELVNAFTTGVKSVSTRNRVVAGATAPFGDPSPGTTSRIPPARFVRDWLSARTRFDILSHHPYSTRGPLAPALNDDDVSVPDLKKLVEPLRAAERAGRLSPKGTRPVWVTEMSWDSSPPDPDGVPAQQHARWIAQALHTLWRQNVPTVIWFQIRDQAPEPSYGATNQSGLFLRDGTPKAAAGAFALPLVATTSRVWVRAPQRGTLTIERTRGGRTTTVARVTVAARQVVQRKVSAQRGDTLRAKLGARVSATWRL